MNIKRILFIFVIFTLLMTCIGASCASDEFNSIQSDDSEIIDVDYDLDDSEDCEDESDLEDDSDYDDYDDESDLEDDSD